MRQDMPAGSGLVFTSAGDTENIPENTRKNSFTMSHDISERMTITGRVEFRITSCTLLPKKKS